MRLVRLDIDRLPGIRHPFTVMAEAGVNLVVGPNESGKTSFGRAVFNLLWPDLPGSRSRLTPFSVGAEFYDDGALLARREDTGPVEWTRDGERADAPGLPGGDIAACYRLGLRDLIHDDEDELDRSLARRIRLQMQGGFDLARVRDDFATSAIRARRLQSAWLETRARRQTVQRQQTLLMEQAKSLDELDQQLAAAQLAGRKLDWLHAQDEARCLGRHLTALDTELAELPAALARTREDDHEALAQWLERRHQQEQDLVETRTKLAQRQAELDELEALLGDLTDAGLLQLKSRFTGCRHRNDRLRETERALAAAEARQADARAELDPAALAGADPDDPGDLYRRLLEVHRDRLRLDMEQDQLRDMNSWRELAAPPPPTDDADRREAIAGLQAWLGGRSTVRPGSAGLLTAGLITAAGAMVTALTWPGQGPDSWLVTGGGLAVAALGLLSIWRFLVLHRRHSRAARDIEALCTRTGQALPAGWDLPEALEHLARLQEALDLHTGANALRLELRRLLEQKLQKTDKQQTATLTAYNTLLEESGLPPETTIPGLLHALDRLRRYHDARATAAEARGAWQHDADDLAVALADLRDRLEARGQKVTGDLDELDTALGRLTEAHTRRQSLAAAQQDARDAERRESAALQRTEDDIAGLLQRLVIEPGPEAVHAVADLVAALPLYHELQAERSTRQGELQAIEQKLNQDADLMDPAAYADLEPSRWAELLERYRLQAADAEGLSEQRADLRARIDHARDNRDLEIALAAEDEARHALEAARDSERDATAANLLLDEVEQQYQTNTRPPLLSAAIDYFRRFTRGRYELRVVHDDVTTFVAVDSETGAPRKLSELSDGTRAQLLLAARLAFITRSELSARPPLFLDEALTASDPERFAAIAGALAELAMAEDRQIFYLTGNPADVAAWEQVLAGHEAGAPHVIDLAAVRQLSTAAATEQLDPPVTEPLPEPGDLAAADYAVRLGVPGLDAWAEATAAHAFYLLRDDLLLLRDLLTAGAPTVGRFKAQQATLLRAGVITPAQAGRLGARSDVLAAFLTAWRVGRGRPLDRTALATADILTEKMLHRAYDLLDETGPDALKLIERMETGAIARLGAKFIDALRESLQQRGYLDPRQPMAENEVLGHVLDAVAGHLADHRLQLEEVRSLVSDLYKGAAAGSNRQAAQ